ncbi:unnamed protein product [Penicillium salamii]|uniref:Golgi apparatus membrane protein TVP18 n=1 Tax=Penicillium salamii TaxID=1612424 RepID=A0A9W4NH72_9EURO|nr:unnamed protein product [Penicillium salamii]CAG8366469.1 unnamed protein product [Penicillium salamii]CAG8385326.1 unnamed protein product [Penicillium salamii]
MLLDTSYDRLGTPCTEHPHSIYRDGSNQLSRTGVLCIILCLALGIANIFSFNAVLIIFSCLCIASAFVVLFIEVPFLLRICPTSPKFDSFIRRFTTNWMRAGIYVALSAIQWVSLVSRASSLIAAAVFLLIAAVFYALAAVTKQEFVGSKTLGGQGVAQMIV